ncbi:hypothetical protein MEN41_03560 [Dolichospermum sp. ST_con]|nr:hypothetical protein [Dolichospermum sp. ST_con]MDD1418695.1 hypothetical protein [Dolichospermum sp. ST_sed1]MDD1424514.1 hypothetical protein [Dolichospermum sp. ST_sed9]MDD1429640.1 hypothetical protein [Dolichospermum sp. ST_sed6]MDD1438268.1 hypothetical protein [Dolichospermum sp. ST_sed10]MDD1440133.1 hypothetical protein [Dolichospermum sp. ST_sed3]MDD1447449.1 hypothetical protein [Dolichospermum sp. ST_sed8]MDD1455510.1 hypothetical protein [Dolichospermum sp. ST_sed7]MDD145959
MSIELDKKIINSVNKACLFEIREEVLVTEAIKKTPARVSSGKLAEVDIIFYTIENLATKSFSGSQY